MTRHDSRRNRGSYSPVSRRISRSNEPSAASNWKPRCSSSFTPSSTRAAALPSRPLPALDPPRAARGVEVAARVRDHRALAGELGHEDLAGVAHRGWVDVLEG